MWYKLYDQEMKKERNKVFFFFVLSCSASLYLLSVFIRQKVLCGPPHVSTPISNFWTHRSFCQHRCVYAFQSIVYHGMKAIRWKHLACALGIAVHKPHLESEIWYDTFGSMKKHLALKWEIGYESLCTNTKCLGIFCPCQTIIFLSSVYLQLMIEFQSPKNPISALCMYPQYTQLLPVHTAACTAKLISSL